VESTLVTVIEITIVSKADRYTCSSSDERNMDKLGPILSLEIFQSREIQIRSFNKKY